MSPFAQFRWPLSLLVALSITLLLLSACNVSIDINVTNGTTAGTPQPIESVTTTTQLTQQIVTSTPPPVRSATASPQALPQDAITEQDRGKIVTYTISSRMSLILDGQLYPRAALTLSCNPPGALGSISNIPYVKPPLYAVRYQAVKGGFCTIRNGSFWFMVKVIPLPD